MIGKQGKNNSYKHHNSDLKPKFMPFLITENDSLHKIWNR